MKWIKFKRADRHDVFIRDDDIDYFVVYKDDAKIYQKNGKYQIVKSSDVWPQIAEDQLIDAEKKKRELNALYGMAAARPLPDYDPDILRKDIEDLKLENDRLKKRDNIMLKFVRSAYCSGMSCFDCLFYDMKQPTGKKCVYSRNEIFADISHAANDVLQELDNL